LGAPDPLEGMAWTEMYLPATVGFCRLTLLGGVAAIGGGPDGTECSGAAGARLLIALSCSQLKNNEIWKPWNPFAARFAGKRWSWCWTRVILHNAGLPIVKSAAGLSKFPSNANPDES
jgi:hypothetical protein